MRNTSVKIRRYLNKARSVYRNEGLLELLAKIPLGIYLFVRQILFDAVVSDAKSRISGTPSKEMYYKTRSKSDLEKMGYTEDNKASELLFDLVQKHSGKDVSELSALEIGCNAGRRVNRLHKEGFKNLSGIEINPDAIDLMRESFPNLRKDIDVKIGPAQEMITQFESNSFDVVYTVSVLMHIESNSKQLFDNIERVLKPGGILVTMECENSEHVMEKLGIHEHYEDWQRHRNYRKVFEKRGLRQKEEINAWEDTPEAGKLSVLRVTCEDTKTGTHTARVFKNNSL